MNDILVISSERSGTHYLIDSIRYNYPQYAQFDRVDVPPSGKQEDFEKFFLQDFEYGLGRIVKTHHQWQFFDPIWDKIKDRFHIFYIARDGRDVMTSCHYYFNKAPRAEFPYTKTVGELLRKNPQAFSFDAAYSKVRSNTMVERWARHVRDWFKHRGFENIMFLTYEKLYMDFYGTIMREISGWMNEFAHTPVIRPTIKTGTGISPRKGIIGDWTDHFHLHDINYFFNEVSKISPELYGRIFRMFSNNRLKIEFIPERI